MKRIFTENQAYILLILAFIVLLTWKFNFNVPFVIYFPTCVAMGAFIALLTKFKLK